MKHYIEPLITVVKVNNKDCILAGSPQLNDKYISSNKDLAKEGTPFSDEDYDY